MTSFTLKNVPPGLYDLLKKRAQHNRRSLNNEILFLLEESLGMREELAALEDAPGNYVVTADKQHPLRGMPIIYHEPFESVEETAWLSEPALAKDWDRPEEDEAWAHLQPDK